MDLNSLLDDYNEDFNNVQVCDNLDNIKCFRKDNNNLNLLHVNIRSINKNVDSLILFIESLCGDFDIIVLSETNIIDCKSRD